jgi:hypothetical protein
VLRRKYNPNSARPRIFDGAAEAKLIALTLSPAPEGFARWSLRLLEEKVVELHIVERASDNTIGRTLKTFSSREPSPGVRGRISNCRQSVSADAYHSAIVELDQDCSSALAKSTFSRMLQRTLDRWP